MIKVTIGDEPIQNNVKPFPKLMKSHRGSIVLFHCNEKGICLVMGKDTSTFVGEYCGTWKMDAFTDYNEPITIQNV